MNKIEYIRSKDPEKYQKYFIQFATQTVRSFVKRNFPHKQIKEVLANGDPFAFPHEWHEKIDNFAWSGGKEDFAAVNKEINGQRAASLSDVTCTVLAYMQQYATEEPDPEPIRKAKTTIYDGEEVVITINITWDDKCCNGYKTFSVTGEINYLFLHKWIGKEIAFGCIHKELEQCFPEYKHLLKWHLVSEDGPMHYIKNTTHWAKQGNLEYARECAIWPDATLKDLRNVQLLELRLPTLMEEFKRDLTELGFKF